MDSAQVVRRFKHEFKNNANHGIVDELMSGHFVHHLPYPGLRRGAPGCGPWASWSPARSATFTSR